MTTDDLWSLLAELRRDLTELEARIRTAEELDSDPGLRAASWGNRSSSGWKSPTEMAALDARRGVRRRLVRRCYGHLEQARREVQGALNRLADASRAA